MPKIERKYLAHFLDAKFGVKTQGEETYTPNYTRLGKDLEEYNEELNPDVEVNKTFWANRMSSTMATRCSLRLTPSMPTAATRCLNVSQRSPMSA